MPAQTALDLLTCRAAAATPAAVDSGDGTACGRDKEVSEFRMTLFIILLLPHQNLCIDLDHSAAEAHVLMVTDPILLHMHVIDGVTGGCGGGGGGAPAGRRGEPAAAADAGGAHPQLQRALPSAHPSPAGPAAAVPATTGMVNLN